MKLIGLTQRVDMVQAYAERRDALDQNWSRLLERAGFLPVPLSNAVGERRARGYLEALPLSGVILTGGNDLSQLGDARNPAPERDRFEWALLSVCLEREIPVVGICRGMQVINVFMGGALVPVEAHAGTRHAVDWEGKSMDVGSYHDYAIRAEGMGAELEVTARCEDGTIEGFRHKSKALVGLMWHPEREDPFREEDLQFLKAVFEGAHKA